MSTVKAKNVIILPCALGAKVYHIIDKGNNIWEIEEGCIYEVYQRYGEELGITEKYVDIEGNEYIRYLSPTCFGKTAFVDKASAEEAINKFKGISKAIIHFKNGIDQDIFSEPVTSYAKLAVEALENYREVFKNGLSGI